MCAHYIEPEQGLEQAPDLGHRHGTDDSDRYVLDPAMSRARSRGWQWLVVRNVNTWVGIYIADLAIGST